MSYNFTDYDDTYYNKAIEFAANWRYRIDACYCCSQAMMLDVEHTMITLIAHTFGSELSHVQACFRRVQTKRMLAMG